MKQEVPREGSGYIGSAMLSSSRCAGIVRRPAARWRGALIVLRPLRLSLLGQLRLAGRSPHRRTGPAAIHPGKGGPGEYGGHTASNHGGDPRARPRGVGLVSRALAITIGMFVAQTMRPDPTLAVAGLDQANPRAVAVARIACSEEAARPLPFL